MNTSVWVRSLISKQYSVDKFFKHVVVTLGKEFEAKIYYSTEKDEFEFSMLGFSINIHRDEVENLQKLGLYSLDRYILEELKKLGFKFNINRSQYIQCCYGIFNNNEYSMESIKEVSVRFNQIFNIPIVEGSLFYPCCGIDTYEPLALFINSIKEFHFADGGQILLPLLECGVYKGSMDRNKDNKDHCGSFSSDVIPFAVSLPNNDNLEVIKKIEENFMVNFHFINAEDISVKEVWKTKFKKNKKIDIYCHRFEGALSLVNIEKISVFYYRVYSKSLSSSSFNWFSHIAFNSVLKKLVSGGIIITDGGEPKNMKEDVPWKSFWNNDAVEFSYKNRNFTYIGECGDRYGKMKVWKVD
ncbi:hypothetical protein BD780_000641 [Clostridium tetanomorphum]|uniref:hypothetical protein n=1 Tax=Clostridium tetanomorphum TaxID=1553 RepID=UPI0004498E06|nr:hypothetical protein [Clostridium tetanomorphum]KAJ49583.1 hypothetical protein CTM_22354 [Clostridium tetanomorphum DSM 665]KAJ51752.1 hypothetical protein CTM_10808 [Clostridium tetanomorphum DSM 665]MBP1864987.1 hypothetical protein [Clostridium tetanomorphum]NRS83416.1 hypothetical protein [Clostridium tetanomorphum]SQC01475.1 Uncharacterised protein [Clostridium tetanomorphum]